MSLTVVGRGEVLRRGTFWAANGQFPGAAPEFGGVQIKEYTCGPGLVVNRYFDLNAAFSGPDGWPSRTLMSPLHVHDVVSLLLTCFEKGITMAVEKTIGSNSLVEVVDRILDKGIVVDAWVRVSLVGIELLAVEARVVAASVETYLKYAEAIGLTATAA